MKARGLAPGQPKQVQVQVWVRVPVQAWVRVRHARVPVIR
jgi:hypothetical protein